MESAEAVSQRAAYCRVAAVGGDKFLLQGGVSGIAGRLLFILGRNRDSVLFEDVQHVREHGMDDETVVIVEMEDGSVAVPAVADIPVHEAGQGVIDGGAFVFAGEFQQGRLNHCGEEQPVALVRLYHPRRFEGADEILLRFGVQTVPKCVRSADQALCKESGVHERLVAVAEVEEVGRRRIHRVGNRLDGKGAVFLAQAAFGGVPAFQFKPWSNAADHPSQGLQMGISSPAAAG